MEEKVDKSSFKSYLFFWSGQLVSILGSSVVYFVLLWWLVDGTESAVALSIGSVSYFVPFILVSLIAGVVADRYDRKKVILIADSLQAFSTFIMILFFAYGIMEYWYLYFFFAFRSTCQAFHQPTQNAIIPTMVPKEKLSRINGINYLLTGVIHIIGPMIGATFLIFLTVEQALWIDIITYLISIVPLLLVKIPSFHKETEDKKRESMWKEFKSGIKILTTIPGLLALILEAMMVNFLAQPISTLLPYYIRIIHNGSVVDFALISMSFNVGMFIGGILTTIKKKWKYKVPIMISAGIIYAIAYALFSFVPTGFFILIMLYTVIMGFTLPIWNALFYTILQLKVPSDKLGRITSIDNTFSCISIPLGSILAGPLVVIIGIGPLFFISASLIVIVEIVVYLFTKVRLLDSEEDSSQEPG
ncbi:Enterobactin exporter EntS [subsurface metagenome]